MSFFSPFNRSLLTFCWILSCRRINIMKSNIEEIIIKYKSINIFALEKISLRLLQILVILRVIYLAIFWNNCKIGNGR